MPRLNWLKSRYTEKYMFEYWLRIDAEQEIKKKKDEKALPETDCIFMYGINEHTHEFKQIF